MGKYKQICIIDDDPIFLTTTTSIMKLVGFCDSFVTFTNGKEAIQKLTEMHQDGIPMPDLILLDLNMPIMDGWAFIDKVCEEKLLTVPIFIVSSSVAQHEIYKAKQSPCVVDFIQKPLMPDKLQKISVFVK